ncbi:sensor histidine kinase [Bogoriella caseilytica]|uniref:histidine kinase n=1 Tax=Bogoriella caseilytica TaxID=56055 RepID=A0A3N2B8Y2_9MICO|nr:histidine kinase [Bogoriella caseilytica]ROR71717.1 signal transduction histidine kinase [Bogoriella caseilytica]
MTRFGFSDAATWARSEHAVPQWTRWAITVGFALLFALEASAYFFQLEAADQASLVSSALTSALVILTAWQPALGGLLYLVGAFAVLGWTDPATFSIGIVLVAALVAYACTKPARIVLLAIAAGWPWLAVMARESVIWLDAVVMSAFIAGAVGIGLAFRRMSSTMNRMAADYEAARKEALAKERRRLAAELHDIVGHGLTVIAMQSRALEFISDAEERRRSHRAIGDAAQQTAGDMRRLLAVLHDDDSRPGSQRAATSGSLRARVAHFVDHLTSTGISTKATWSGARELPQSIEVNLVRIAQEATTNILKHGARPGHAEFIITFGEQEVEMIICNEIAPSSTTSGRTRKSPSPGSGFGLLGLTERATLFGGTLDTSVEDQTWTLRVALPLR